MLVLSFVNGMLPTGVVLVLLRCLSALRPPLRVHDGLDDIHNEFPFAVRLEVEGMKFCTGSLIARNWVLTAGHCTGEKGFVVRYANFTKKHARGSVARVLKVIKHPNYENSLTKLASNDIALLQTTNIPDKTIGKISALDYRSLMGLPVKYAGFGRFTEEAIVTNLSDAYYYATEMTPLQVGEAVVRPYFHGEQIKARNRITILLSPKCSKRWQAARPGDSGGPVIYDGKIVGVASAVNYRRTNSKYDCSLVYTAVSPYLSWIRYQMHINGYKKS